MTGMSFPLHAVLDFARARGDDASVAELVSGHLSRLEVPEADWGGLDFSAELSARWTAALGDRQAELGRLSERLSGTRERLLRTTEEFAELDAAAARRIRRAGDGEADAGDDGPRTHAPSKNLPAPPGATDRDSPGGEDLLTCRTEHLPTLKRAEQLLRDAGRLDFTAPTDYLGRLAGVKPGAVGGRADALSTLSSHIDLLGQDIAAETQRLTAHWEGTTAEEVGSHSAGTTGRLRRAAAGLEWLSGEAEQLWRLLDGLLLDVAEAVWGHLNTVGTSRIARIDAAVTLVEDARGFAPDASGIRALWGGLSNDDMDAAVQVLYKRVWYLADAMGGLVSQAGRDARTRITEDDDGESDL